MLLFFYLAFRLHFSKFINKKIQKLKIFDINFDLYFKYFIFNQHFYQKIEIEIEIY